MSSAELRENKPIRHAHRDRQRSYSPRVVDGKMMTPGAFVLCWNRSGRVAAHLGPSCVSRRRSSNANSLGGRNSG
jgi:hypothetical protein